MPPYFCQFSPSTTCNIWGSVPVHVFHKGLSHLSQHEVSIPQLIFRDIYFPNRTQLNKFFQINFVCTNDKRESIHITANDSCMYHATLSTAKLHVDMHWIERSKILARQTNSLWRWDLTVTNAFSAVGKWPICSPQQGPLFKLWIWSRISLANSTQRVSFSELITIFMEIYLPIDWWYGGNLILQWTAWSACWKSSPVHTFSACPEIRTSGGTCPFSPPLHLDFAVWERESECQNTVEQHY